VNTASSVEAKVLSHGGAKRVSQVTGVARKVHPGRDQGTGVATARTAGRTAPHIGRAGAGRKKLVDRDPDVREALERLVEPASRGDPRSPLRWTCKSLMQLTRELSGQGHAISHVSVGVLLKDMGVSLQGNRKTLEGASHPDRNAQFEYINDQTQAALHAIQPVISVDTKKKELVGRYKNGGKEWMPQGEPEQVKVHDFVTLWTRRWDGLIRMASSGKRFLTVDAKRDVQSAFNTVVGRIINDIRRVSKRHAVFA